METEIGEVKPQAKDCLELLETGRSMEWNSLEASEIV